MLQKFAIKLLPEANKNIDEISENLIAFYGNKISANKVMHSIRSKIRELKYLPEGYPRVGSDAEFEHEYHRAHTKHYSIYFYVEKEKKRVIVATIVDARMNPKLVSNRLLNIK